MTARDNHVIPATATSFPRTREPRVKQSTPLPRKRTGPTKAARGKRLFLCLWIPASAGMTGAAEKSSPSRSEGDAKERSEFRRGCTGRGGASPRPQQPAPRTSPSIPRSHRCACSRPLRKAKGGNLTYGIHGQIMCAARCPSPTPDHHRMHNTPTTPPSFPSFKILHIIVQKNSARIATGAVLSSPSR